MPTTTHRHTPATARCLLTILFLAIFSVTGRSNTSPELENLAEPVDLRDLRFEEVELFPGHTAGRIHAITQCRNGFMWIGTRQGLTRYDGRRVRSFSRIPQDPSSIPDDSVTKLHIDLEGRLWVGTLRGLALYVPETENFIRFLQPQQNEDQSISNQVNGIVHDSDGTIYTTNEAGRLFKFDEEKVQFSQVSPSRFGSIKSLAADPNGRLWIGSNDQLIRIDPNTLEETHFRDSISSADDPSINYVLSICYVSDSEIWLGTSNFGVLVLNSIDGSVEALPYGSQPEGYVNQVDIDEEGRIWSANNAGLTIIERDTRSEVLSIERDRDLLSTPPSGINTLFIDHQGGIWVGSNFDGVAKTKRVKRFETLALHERNSKIKPFAPAGAFLEDRAGNLWVGQPLNGLALYPSNGDNAIIIDHSPDDPLSLPDQPILCLFEDSMGVIWIGTYRGGLFSYTPTTKKLKAYLNDPNNPRTIGGHDIRAITESPDGRLWIATHGNGLSALDPLRKKFTNYTRIKREETGVYIANDWINDILIDRNQNLWLASHNGVTRISADRKNYIHYTADPSKEHNLSSSQATDLAEDSKGRIWIATLDGLNVFLPESDSFKSYSLEHGLPDRKISSTIEDLDGAIWVATYGGLARFDPISETAQSFDVSDGLASDDFLETSVSQGAGGMLYFGQSKGLTYFNPRDIKQDTQKPSVFITGIRAQGKPLSVSQDGPLTKSVLHTSKLNLDYKQNSVVFEFVAIDYKNPTQNSYRYKLEGFDNSWTQADNRAEAFYTNLPAGRYVFRVQGSNGDGFWNDSGDTIAVQITPPFWGTLIFRLFAVLLIIMVPVSLFIWRMNAMRNEAHRLEIAVSERTKDLKQANILLEEANIKTQFHGELLERTVKERTQQLEIAKEAAERSDKLKSAFLANMSHEIRTPMNAIMGFLNMLENSDLSEEERKQFHGIIHQSSKSLMSLIDDILDLSAIEAGEADISFQICDIDEICKELGALFRETITSQKRGSVTFECERNLPASIPSTQALSMLIDPLRLKQIIWNLLSNALKFTEKGEIKLIVTVSETDKQGQSTIEFSVKDTGIGIPLEEHKRIFKRFHKLDDIGKKLYRGTGLGLAITDTLTKLMNGTITLESEPNVGTQFFVTFPFSNSPQSSVETKTLEERSFLETDLSEYKILFVEDEVPNYEYVQRVLKGTGLKLDWAKDGQEAIDRFKARPYDLVLLDLKLPGMHGYEVSTEIRKMSKHVPIIVQSAFAMREDRVRSEDAGANEHLSKPFSPNQLISLLSKHLLNPGS